LIFDGFTNNIEMDLMWFCR